MSAELHDILKEVSDEKTLLKFVEALISDRLSALKEERQSPNKLLDSTYGGWENTSIEAFLEGAAAWAESTNFGATQGLTLNNPWRRFANFLYCGKIYE